WSHDGTTIVYVSPNASLSGRFNQEMPQPGVIGGGQASTNSQRAPGMTNLYTVPFNNGLGGAATPVLGAASTTAEEIYPAFSPDDSMIAFTRVPPGGPMYANPHAGSYAVRTPAGAPTPPKANTPPT